MGKLISHNLRLSEGILMKSKLTKVVGATLVSLLITSTMAYATPQSKPNGPYIENEQNISLSSLMTNQQLYDTLTKIAARSNGKMKLEIAGYSNANPINLMEKKGYPLYVVKFGDADPAKKRVMITSQIHGNEPIGTEAAVDLMQKLASGGKEVDDILSQVSIWFMPRINPDGAANTYEGNPYPTRYTHQTWSPLDIGLATDTTPPWYYNPVGSERAQNNNGTVVYGIPGYDENRDFNPNLDLRIENIDSTVVQTALNDRSTNRSTKGGFFVTPEARIVTKVFQEFKPDVYFDLHHRGFNTVSDTDNRSVIIQVAAVVSTGTYKDDFSDKTLTVSPATLELGKQVNVLGYQSLQRGTSDFGAIQKYPNVDLPGTSLGAFNLNGAAIMLIEIKGQTQSLGQKERGKLVQTVKEPVYAVFKALADGSISDIDADLYDQIPVSANGIGDPSTRD